MEKNECLDKLKQIIKTEYNFRPEMFSKIESGFSVS